MEAERESRWIDLDALGLTHGDATRIETPVEPGTVTLGGQGYRPSPDAPVASVDVSRTMSGYALRLRYEVAMEGPCFRCLEPASSPVRIDVREVDQPLDGSGAGLPGPSPAEAADEDEGERDAGEDELSSPYIEAGRLDLAGWARDALILSLPNQILCAEGCPGLCPFCGESLKGADPAEHDHGQNRDPRWSKLRDLG